jgi:hypothetical protein
MHVYYFDFLKQATQLLSNPDLIEGSLWGNNPQIDATTGERVYQGMNTGDIGSVASDTLQIATTVLTLLLYTKMDCHTTSVLSLCSLTVHMLTKLVV